MPIFSNVSKAPSLLFAVSSFYEKPSEEMLKNALEFLFVESFRKSAMPDKFSVTEFADSKVTIFPGNTKEVLMHEPHNIKVVSFKELLHLIIEMSFMKKLAFFSLKNLTNIEIINFIVIRITGSLELPQIVAFFLNRHKTIDGVVALGIIKKGKTDHNVYVASGCTEGLNDVALRYLVPLTTGIITSDSDAIIDERIAKDGKNIGMQAVKTCLDIINVKRKLDSFF